MHPREHDRITDAIAALKSVMLPETKHHCPPSVYAEILRRMDGLDDVVAACRKYAASAVAEGVTREPYSPWTCEYLRHTAARIESEGALSSPEHRRELLKIATRVEAMANQPDDPGLSGTLCEPTTQREAKEAHAERLRHPHLEVLAGALRAELLNRLLENDALLNPEKYR